MKRITALIVVALMFVSVSAFAKVGVVNFQKVLTTSDAGKTVHKKLQQKADEFDAELKKISDRVTAIQQEYEKQESLLTPEAKDAKRAEVNRLVREFQGMKEDSSKRLRRMESRELQTIEEDVIAIVDKLGKELGYELIIEMQTAGVMYFSEKINITDIVIERYNKEWNANQ
ncbi:OmpH family outer membrane protein [Limisalsivibrio acetivorans]|uniref:OmpH family outer membrane protein n=1 Tax=Limisalsivibrio acetivorans TaxID=1304888 RepID=UPI0003B44920|nr:OmpH family outer membrane protein [Limisalsivibrio acetivorans]